MVLPASAGSTMSRRSRTRSTGAHPRVCGEHGTLVPRIPIDTGSSPRLRGAHSVRKDHFITFRLIPASAGSTQPVTDVWWSATAHPRVCGEHAIGKAPGSVWSGSSPRLRGARFRALDCVRSAGLIPASAGSTSPHPSFPRRRRLIPASAGSTLADKHFRQG